MKTIKEARNGKINYCGYYEKMESGADVEPGGGNVQSTSIEGMHGGGVSFTYV